MGKRIYLSPPHMSGKELKYVKEAFAENWIAPVGPHLNAFEAEICAYTGAEHAVALTSGTAALHLGLILLGVGRGDRVFVSDLTFSGSVNPIRYLGAVPVFIDSEATSWNLDPILLEQALEEAAAAGQLPKAVMPVHLYGQAADMTRILQLCRAYGVPVLEDAAEGMGTSYEGQHAGTLGVLGAFSFNGNKIITSSGGGMLVSDDKALIDRARKLATQAREPVPHYEHHEIGYNYRMSNIVAGVGRGQLTVLEERVQRKREIYALYAELLGSTSGLTFVPDVDWGRHTRWLSVMLVDPAGFGADRETIRLHLEAHNIESRPVWKPMHLQPVFAEHPVYGGGVSEQLFEQGLCLPCGTALTDAQIEEISQLVLNTPR